MRILFVIGAGILPEQRIHRWQMVSQLYAKLGKSFIQLGHQVYYLVHPEAYHEDVPPHLTWQSPDHTHLPHILEQFKPNFVFCWNGSSAGDVTTATIAQAHGAKMVFSEQGWFPQKTTLYFDFAGCNGKCGTRHKKLPPLKPEHHLAFIESRRQYIEEIGETKRFPTAKFTINPPDLSKPVFVPLQDERDLNIIQDSPFKTMNDFVGHIAAKWPQHSFIVRPHPKYPTPALDAYPNVRMDNPKRPMFESLAACGVVVGINSTTLLESALLGYTVISFGESLATGTGLFYDARPETPVNDLKDIRIDTGEAASVLFHLLRKQMLRDSLDKPQHIMRSSMFQELYKYMNWNLLQPTAQDERNAYYPSHAA